MTDQAHGADGKGGWVARVRSRVARADHATRPLDPASDAALRARWDGLPAHAHTDAQVLGRVSLGCEGTHGVFPQCDFACKPCYHSADANKVRIDGRHTVEQIAAQMALLHAARGPAAYAQLIGGEVSLLDPEDHADALEAMWSHGRVPMSFSHGDFDDEYLRRVVVRSNGTPRFASVSWSLHIDSTMRGRRGIPKPTTERELNPVRREVCDRFARVRAEHGIRSYLAHTMTVTPSNLGQIADVVRDNIELGFRMFSFQPAAYVGNQQRWEADYRSVTDDVVWEAIGQGVGRPLPHRVLQVGDLRCNRVSWGAVVNGAWVPVLEDDDPLDAAARDAFFEAFRGNRLSASPGMKALRTTRAVLTHVRGWPIAASWLRRFVRRAGGIRAFRHGVRPVTFVMHSFIDAADVAPAWAALARGEVCTDARLSAAQERLQACSYTMAHPETGELVPACVQHAVLDPAENRQLVTLLPRRAR